MAGIVLALIGAAVLVVAVVALHDPRTSASNTSNAAGSSSGPAPSGSAAPPTSSPSGGPSATSPGRASTSPPVSDGVLRASVPLVVLNNSTISGLAAEASQRFQQGGWTVTSIGNLTNNIISTCAYYDPSVTDAKAAAQALRRQYPTIKRVEPRFDGLDTGPVVVVLTSDYSNG